MYKPNMQLKHIYYFTYINGKFFFENSKVMNILSKIN